MRGKTTSRKREEAKSEQFFYTQRAFYRFYREGVVSREMKGECRESPEKMKKK